ncbi:MAG: SEC-C metal-binding domain-containing protein [Kiritimatiellia bacterium]
MISQTRPNDYCPCGSGSKYKKCCMLKDQSSRPLTRHIVNEASIKAMNMLIEFAVKHPEPVKTPPLNRPPPEMPDAEAQRALQNGLLARWIIYLWHPRGTPGPSSLPSDRTVAARFLRQEGEKLDGVTRRFIEAARSEPFSYWQVEAISAGASLLLRDMVTGEERVVCDESTSRMAARWDILFAHAVGLDGIFIFNSLGPYPLVPDRFRQHIATLAEFIRKQSGPSADRRKLLAYQDDFIEHYLECLEAVLHPKLPELRNMDGDKLAFVKSSYAFNPNDRQKVITALISLDGLEKTGEDGNALKFAWLALPKNRDNKQKVLKAGISLGQDRLESDCNSEKRDKALRKLLLKNLGALITHTNTNLQPFDPDKLREPPSSAKADKTGEIDLASLSKEDRRQFEEILGKQHMSWLDERVPMLGGKTPRETAKTAQGKMQVAEMINDWENMQNRTRNSQFTFDFNKLRSELGIEPA